MPECVFRNVKIHVEVSLLLLFFAFLLSDPVQTNLIIFRTCYVTLGYAKDECALLGSKNPDNQTANLEKIVEPHAVLINMASTVAESCTSSIACLFLGPWSDRFGRKPVLIISTIGYMLYYVFITIFASLENLSPWYSLICLFPVHFSGGISSYLAVVSCYISDLTRDNSRGMRMGIAEAALFMGVFLGTVSSSYLLAATNYATVFLFSAICCFLSVAFIACFVPESLPHPESEGRFKGLFQLSNLDEMLKITFKKRQNYERCTIICCVLMVIVSVVARNGNSAVIFLFLREKFHWSLQTYTLFSAAGSVTSVFGTLIGLYFLHKLMKIPETVLILVAFISSLNGALVLGWAQNNTSVYSVPFIQLLGGMFGPMVRSLVSKIIPNEEVGKILALVSAAQFFFGMAGSPIYSAIYNKTISTHSEIFNFVTAGFYVFEILITICIIYVRTVYVTTSVTYTRIINEESENCGTVATDEMVA